MSKHNLSRNSNTSHPAAGINALRIETSILRPTSAAISNTRSRGQLSTDGRSDSHSDLAFQLLSRERDSQPRRLVPQLAHLDASNRRELFAELAGVRGPRRLPAMEAVLMSSGSMRELSALMKPLPAEDKRSPRLAGLYLKTIMLDACRPFLSLKGINPRDLKDTNKARDALISSFSTICKGQLEFGHSAPVLERRAFLQFSRALLKELSRFPSQESEEPTSARHVDYLVTRAEIFKKFGVMLLNGMDLWSREKASWSMDEIHTVSRTLKHLPRWALIGTPLLCSIIRRSSCAEQFQACRARSGDIEMHSLAFSSGTGAPYLKGWSDQQICLVHEICHGLHFGDRYTMKLAADGAIQECGNEAIAFNEFAALSNWRVVEKNPLLRRHNNYALARGIEVPLEVPVQLNARERVQFSFDQHAPNLQPLWSHNPDAGFAFGPNSHRSPWEDYADSGTMYFLAPAIFQQLAPAKFAHFESVYRMYPDGVPRAKEILPENGHLNPAALEVALRRNNH